jgi:ketosteroid isomerase-like protein
MKHCPSCQSNYTDDTLQFCLQDGTQLVGLANTNAPTVAYTEEATIIRPKPPEQVVPLGQPNFQTQPQQNWQTNPTNFPSEQKKSGTAKAVLLTILAMLVLFGAGVGAWLFLNNQKQVALNVNVNSNSNRALNNVNASNNQNAATTSPSVTPTPKPTLDPKQGKAVTEAVKNTIDDWKDATENRDLEAHINQYADTVDYYKAGKVPVSRVRTDREKAFNAYDSMNVNIKNLKITPDETGEKATVILDKEWKFEGEEKYSSGEVQQQLTLAKIGGRWLITGEKDLKVYRVEKE